MLLQRFDPLADMARVSHRRYLDADVYRIGETFHIELDAPGVSIDDIDLEIEEKHLTVTVERRPMQTEDPTDVVRGRPTGRFTRRFFLGDSLDGESITASYDNGVLSLSIPIVETVKARKISINGSPALETQAG